MFEPGSFLKRREAWGSGRETRLLIFAFSFRAVGQRGGVRRYYPGKWDSARNN